MTDPSPASGLAATDGRLPERVAVVGAGVIGSAWAARWALCGADVTVADPSPDAATRVGRTLDAACAAWRRLRLLDSDGSLGTVTVVTPEAGCAPAVAGAELIHECVPERLTVKQAAYAEIEAAAAPDAVIASSTSGIRPSDLQAEMRHPQRLVVGHPFNPVYLLPLVEVVGGARTSESAIERAMGWFSAAGMSPLRVRSDIDGFVADRLMEALWREALWLVHDGVATVSEIDDTMRLGFGLRWAQMGVFQTYATAGGEGGFRQFVEHFAPTLDLPWTKLTDVPELTPEFVATLLAQSDEQSGGRPVAELCAARDRNLVDLLLALEANDWGAGRSLAALRERLADRR